MLFFIFLSFMLFFIGIQGVIFFKKNFMNILMTLELMLLALNFNFVIFSCYLDDMLGQLYCLMILTMAAAESSMGLALLIIYYRLSGGISLDLINLLKS